jgi:hypothetical protein
MSTKKIQILCGIAAALCAISLGGCGWVQARDRYHQSLNDYRACLAANGANTQACEGKRVLMETDEHVWNSMFGNANNANDANAKCQSYGAKPGDPAYVQCRAQLDAAATQASATYSASQPRYDPYHDDPLYRAFMNSK